MPIDDLLNIDPSRIDFRRYAFRLLLKDGELVAKMQVYGRGNDLIRSYLRFYDQ